MVVGSAAAPKGEGGGKHNSLVEGQRITPKSAEVLGAAGAAVATAAKEEGGGKHNVGQRYTPKTTPPCPKSELNMVLFPVVPKGTDGASDAGIMPPPQQTWWVYDKCEIECPGPICLETYNEAPLLDVESFRFTSSDLQGYKIQPSASART